MKVRQQKRSGIAATYSSQERAEIYMTGLGREVSLACDAFFASRNMPTGGLSPYGDRIIRKTAAQLHTGKENGQ